MKKQFQQATRKSCKIKMAVQGPSGSGKTYSALLVAYGITKDWSKIAVIDTENGSANLYAHLGGYSVLTLTAPYTPEQYSEAIDLAAANGFECLIIDSLSAEWSGQGGILDIHSNIPGNSFTAWAQVTPRHNQFVQKILQCDMHVIGTMRSKTEYVISERNGKPAPAKVGLKAVQREDAEYEFTLVFEINQKHYASVSKDRTGLFKNKPETILSSEVGKEIAEWCNSDEANKVAPILMKAMDLEERINECKSIEQLTALYNENPSMQAAYRESFIKKGNLISAKPNTFSTNGVHH